MVCENTKSHKSMALTLPGNATRLLSLSRNRAKNSNCEPVKGRFDSVWSDSRQILSATAQCEHYPLPVSLPIEFWRSSSFCRVFSALFRIFNCFFDWMIQVWISELVVIVWMDARAITSSLWNSSPLAFAIASAVCSTLFLSIQC